MLFRNIALRISQILHELYQVNLSPDDLSLEFTNPDYEGDCTFVVFPLVKILKQAPEKIANDIGQSLIKHNPDIEKYHVIKGFLNLTLKQSFWFNFVDENYKNKQFGFAKLDNSRPLTVIEYSSPNTNKPLHLGHIRNNLIGLSISRIIEANGYPVAQVNLINDRGIHICKTMVAYEKWGNQKTPYQLNIKGDKFVGDLYVKFEQELQKEILELTKQGYSEEEALQKAPLMQLARQKLVQWEAGDEQVLNLWKTMNEWVLEGFEQTYKRMNIRFDKIYFESQTYKYGKDIVLQKLKEGVFYQLEDGSVWVNLEDEKLDHKLLLRSDGTSVYITQDIGTAVIRYNEYNPDRMIYVVGNEQNHHFQVLKVILKKAGFHWYDKIHHLSYGMVELPEGKMKSREGKVVDADDLMDQMVETARNIAKTSGKLYDVPEEIQHKVIEKIALGALNYFILRTDARKNMVFYPEESIDFNGDTGPFIQYTHARICSLLSKAEQENLFPANTEHPDTLISEEKELVKLLYLFPLKIYESYQTLNPAIIAHYAHHVASSYNSFYQNIPVLRAKTNEEKNFRLKLSQFTANVLENACFLLGIEMPGIM